MKKISIICLLIFITTSSISIAQETMTNESVLQMKELGFDDDIIIDKINSSDVKFETSINELSKLKKAGLSSEVLALIMQKSKQNTKTKTGIYYLADDNTQKMIQPSVFSGTSSNKAAQLLVSGLINSKVKSQLPRAKSNNVIKSNSPEFTFIFDSSNSESDNMQTNQGNQAGLLNWWFRTATSPNEFTLVKFIVQDKKNQRELITGKSSNISSSYGIDSKYALSFKIEQIEGNKFRVTPDNLEPGEYCFIYQGNVPEGRTNQSVFDFSIQ